MNDNLSSDGVMVNNSNKTKVIVASCILVFVLIASAIFGYIYYKEYSSPKNQFINVLNKYYESKNLEDIPPIYSLLEDGGSIDLDANINMKISNQNLLNMQANLQIIDNPNFQEEYYNIELKNNNETLVKSHGLVQDNKAYIMLENIFDRFYYTDFEYIQIFQKATRTEKIENNLMNTLNAYFTEGKFVRTKEEITINGTQEQTNKISVSLSEKEFYQLLELILNNLLTDNEALNEFVTFELSLEDIKSSIENVIESLKEEITNSSSDTFIIYNLYLKNNNILMQELTVDTLTVKIEGANEGNISISENNINIITGTYKENELNINYQEGTTNLNIIYTTDTKITDEINSKNNFKITGTYESTNVNINADINFILNNNTTIPTVNITDAKDFNEITDEELERLYGLIMSVVPSETEY